MDFDDRYPAMFHPGGDGLPVPKAVPVPAAALAAAPPATAPPMPLDPPPARAGNLLEKNQDAPAVETTVGEESGSAGSTDQQPPWSVRTWVAGFAAALLCLAAGIFALTATTWIPASRIAKPEDYLGMAVLPWGWLLVDAAAPLVVVGLGMLALMLFLGSLHFPNNARTLRAGVAAIGAAMLLLGIVGIFFDQLFPSPMVMTIDPRNPQRPVPWQLFLGQSTSSFMVVGLLALAVVAVLRPAHVDPDAEPPAGAPAGNASSGTAPSAKAAWLVGLALLGFAAFALFAQLMFPLSMAIETLVEGDHMSQTTPWPQRIIPLAGPCILVGAGTLLWGVLIGATSQRRPNNMSAPQV